MKKGLLWALAMLAFAGTGCTDSDSGPDLVPVEMQCTVPEGFGGWEQGDAIGVFAAKDGAQLPYAAQNVKFVYNGTEWVPAAGSFGVEAGAALYAYYPYSADANDPAALTLRAECDQSSDAAAYRRSAVMTASGTMTETGDVALAFAPVMAEVELTLPRGTRAAGPDCLEVYLEHVATDVTCNLADGSLLLTGDATASVAMRRVEQPEDDDFHSSYTWRAYVPAQTVDAGKPLFRFVHEQWRTIADEALAEPCTLEAGATAQYERRIPGLLYTVLIEPGTFIMGHAENMYTAEHEVTLTKPFRMAKYETTVSELVDFLRRSGIDDPVYTKYESEEYGAMYIVGRCPHTTIVDGVITVEEGYEDYPAGSLSWFCAYEYAQSIGGTLPTEAQWEYACRAGTSTLFSFGDDESMLPDYGWCMMNVDDGQTQEVGQKLPNPWGLYDMHGNASEWTLDLYVEDAYVGAKVDPEYKGEYGQTSGYRIIRSGCVKADYGYDGVSNCWSTSATMAYGGTLQFPYTSFRVIWPLE